MLNSGFRSSSIFGGWLNLISAPLLLLYVICMVVAPYLADGSSWDYVQRVWDRWQTLNAGVLAFMASVIALNISKYHERKQRERQFIAAKAFLPHALSELVTYYKLSAEFYVEAWGLLTPSHARAPFQLRAECPKLPEEYKETFSRCIENAPVDVADYLAGVLRKLQIHHSRMRDMHASLQESSSTVWLPQNVVSYLCYLAQLQVLVAKLFPFSRASEAFDNTPGNLQDYSNAYSNLGVLPENINGLGETTKLFLNSKENF